MMRDLGRYIYTVLFLVLLDSSVALANSFVSVANIKIVKPINLAEIQKLNLGVLVKPGQKQIIEITPEGGIGSSTTATILEQSDISSGKISVVGSEGKNIQVDAAYTNNVPNINFLEVKGNYDSMESNLLTGMTNITSSESQKDLLFGAKVEISEQITEGDYSPELVLSVNYE